jgi:hypothetical protein
MEQSLGPTLSSSSDAEWISLGFYKTYHRHLVFFEWDISSDAAFLQNLVWQSAFLIFI